MENSKQYLIQFIASMQGDKLTVKQLHSIESQTKKMRSSMDDASKSSKGMGISMMSLAKRALMVAPIWMLMRGAIMMVTSTIRNAIQANIAFQENMARIKTVVTASSDSVEADMNKMRSAILGMATKSRFALGDLSEGMYFLRTAGLSTEEALGAFESTVQSATGTTNSLKDTTRIVVGIYNTLGKSMDENLSTVEKFQQINDGLTYTYATQEVQLQELGQSYIQFAPYISGLSDSYIDLITMLGFMNTKMLKSGRAGRMTGRAILQLTTNTEQLAEVFGITFDPQKQINLLDIFDQMNDKLNGIGISMEESTAIQKVFATRAGVPIRILMDNYKEFREVIDRARESSKGFSETMSDIMMHTHTAQMQRLSNIIAVTSNEFFSAASGTGDWVETLKMLNNMLEGNIKNIRTVGEAIGFMTHKWSEFIINISEGKFMKAYKDFFSFDIGSQFSEYTEQINKGRRESEKLTNQNDKLKKIDLARAKETEITKKHEINLLKEQGASEIEIATFRYRQFQLSKEILDPTKKQIQLLELQNDVLEAQLKMRNKIVNTFQKAQIDLLKASGATELQIIAAQEKQLRNNKHNIEDGKYLLQLADLRIQKAIALESIEEREKRRKENLVVQYRNADAQEKRRLKRLFDLMALSPGALTEKFAGIGTEFQPTFDRKLIDDYWSYFSDKQKDALTQRIAIEEGISYKIKPLWEPKELTKTMEEKLFHTDDLIEYWKTWETMGRDTVQSFSEFYKKHLQTEITGISAIDRYRELNLVHKLQIEMLSDEKSKKSKNSAQNVVDNMADKIKTDPKIREAIENIIAEY
jgi:TP901 family phage tail tape measure protein